MTERDTTDLTELTGTKECPFCLAEVPTEASRCRHCTGDFTQPVRAPDLAGFWIVGILLLLVGLGFAASGGDNEWLGVVLLGIGGILTQIATIAWGVSVGMRDRDERMQIKRYENARNLTT